MKVCESCNAEIFTKDGENKCPNCDAGKKPKKKVRRSRKEMDAIMASCGMVRVRGAMGGTYYE